MSKERIEQSAAILKAHWEQGSFQTIAQKIATAESLRELEENLVIRLTLGGADIQILHEVLFMALHYRQDEQDEDDRDSDKAPSSPPDFDPSMN